jgi:hypothetical protein
MEREEEELGDRPLEFLEVEEPEVAIAGSVVKICLQAASVGEQSGEEQW